MDLSAEDFEEGTCGLLKKGTFGAHDAAEKWAMQHTAMMVDAGLRQGVYSACVFYREQKNTRVVAHGDNIAILGASESLNGLRGVDQQRMEVKFKNRLERNKPGSVRILNRIATVTDHRLEHEVDRRHAEILVKDTRTVESSIGVVTLGVVSTGEVGARLRRRSSTAWRRKSI